MATPDSLDKKAAAEKAARAKESQERLAAAKQRVAKARAVKAKYDVEVGGSPNNPTMIARLKGSQRIAGWMQFNDPDAKGFREISMVNVENDARRQGIATTLFQEAKKAGLKPLHSPNRTDFGEEFAKKAGGDVPQRDPFNNSNRGLVEQTLEKEERKAKNKRYGQQRAAQIARQKALQRLSSEREAATQARRNATMIPYRPPTSRVAPPPPPTVTGGLLPRGINAANRIAGPLSFLGTIIGGANEIARTRKPAAMQF
jgi:hypothetical protein